MRYAIVSNPVIFMNKSLGLQNYFDIYLCLRLGQKPPRLVQAYRKINIDVKKNSIDVKTGIIDVMTGNIDVKTRI